METYNHWKSVYQLRRNIKLDVKQKGFVSVDGCFENIKTLQQLIKNQRLNGKEYNIFFIDFAKAFDAVSHKFTVNDLKCK